MLPPWIQQQNIQRQPNQKISNALGLHGTCTSSENPAKLSEQNTENDPAISGTVCKPIRRNKYVTGINNNNRTRFKYVM